MLKSTIKSLIKRPKLNTLITPPKTTLKYFSYLKNQNLFPKNQTFKTLKKPFTTLKDDLSEPEIIKMIYEHRMKMKMYKKETTKMEVNEDYIEEIPTPEFIGKIGVDLNELRYFRFKNIEGKGSSDVNYPTSSWLRVVFPFAEKPHLTYKKNLFF